MPAHEAIGAGPQPVAVEQRTAAPSLGRALLVLSRPEFMPGGVFFIFASAALACLSWAALGDRTDLILWGACVWYLSHLIGSQVNCLADVEIDARDKAHLTRAVRRVGPARIVALMAIEVIATLVIAAHMANETGRGVLPFLWLAGLVLACAYSLEPVRLKRRDWLNPVALTLVLYALPMAYGYVALSRGANAAAVAVLAATGLQMLAVILLNPAEDVASDAAAGIDTPCVRHGLAPVAALAAACFGAGTIVGLVSFAALAADHDKGSVAVAGLAVAAAGQLFVLFEIARLALLARRERAGGELARLVGHNPLHFAVLGVSLALASGAVIA